MEAIMNFEKQNLLALVLNEKVVDARFDACG
jgi:hypothetical protein